MIYDLIQFAIPGLSTQLTIIASMVIYVIINVFIFKILDRIFGLS